MLIGIGQNFDFLGKALFDLVQSHCPKLVPKTHHLTLRLYPVVHPPHERRHTDDRHGRAYGRGRPFAINHLSIPP